MTVKHHEICPASVMVSREANHDKGYQRSETKATPMHTVNIPLYASGVIYRMESVSYCCIRRAIIVNTSPIYEVITMVPMANPFRNLPPKKTGFVVAANSKLIATKNTTRAQIKVNLRPIKSTIAAAPRTPTTALSYS